MVRTELLPGGVLIDHPFPVISSQMAETPEGKILKRNTRWNTYKPEFVTGEQWVGLLGRDADNLDHMKFMSGLTARFLTHNARMSGVDGKRLCEIVRFSPHEQTMLLLTARTHDLAEAIHGDIPASLKTDADTDAEIATINLLAGKLFGLPYPPEAMRE